MEPSRQILWNIGDQSFLCIAAVAAAVFVVAGFVRRMGAWRKGRRGAPRGGRGLRLVALFRAVAVQKGIINGRTYVIMHRSIFYGMLFLFAGTVLVAIRMHFGVNPVRGATYLAYSLALDLAGLAVLVGVGLAAYRRYIVRPDRLESRLSDALLLAMLAVVVLTGFLIKGLRLYATSDPWTTWSPVGWAIAALLSKTMKASTGAHFHKVLWYGHAVLAFTLMAIIPWTKLLHMLAVPVNHYLSLSWADRASPAELPLDAPRMSGVVADLTRKQLIEADACIECGRCKKLCTISQGGVSSSPHSMMKNLRKLIHGGKFQSPLVGSVIDESALWSCSACRSCEERCRMNGAHATTIIDIRRARVDAGDIPEAVAAHFAEDEASLSAAEKTRAAPDVIGDVCIWPGCRGKKAGRGDTVRTLVGLLKRAGVRAAVLDPPACCGGPVRRLGNERLFSREARANIDYLKGVEGKTIITHCPHCFNTLKNEYPLLGGSLRVMHHSQYLAGLLAEGRLQIAKDQSLKATYHDPCFLGRYNLEFSSPRKLITAATNGPLSEMKHNRRKSFCCGSGGGTVAPEVARTNGRAWVRQAIKEGMEAIITSCPYCRENLAQAAIEQRPKGPLPVLDIVELLDAGGSE